MKEKNYVDLLRDRFENWLAANDFPPGSRLPSERELCELLDAKRMTLRQVLIELEVAARIFARTAAGGSSLLVDSSTTQNRSPALMRRRVRRDENRPGVI